MGLTYDSLFPGRFIKAGEFKGKPVTLTITEVFMDDLEKEDGTTQAKAIVSFAETKRQWVLVKTNAQCLLAMWGPEVDAWLGKRVTLYPERDASGLSDSGLCIRVKGSPDITKTVKAEIRLPRRRPQTRTLVPTGNGNGGGDAPPPVVDEATGEVHDEAPIGFDVDETEAPTEPETATSGDVFADVPGKGYEEAVAERQAKEAAGPKANALLLGKLKAAAQQAGMYEAELAALAQRECGVCVSDLKEVSKAQAEALLAHLQGQPEALEV